MYCALQSGETSEHNAEDQSDDNRHQTKLCRDRERLTNRFCDAAPRLQGYTEVSMEKVLHIIDKLHTDRLVESVTLVQRVHDCLCFCLFTVERPAGDCVHGEKGDKADQEQCDNSQQDSLHDILCQLFTLFSLIFTFCL